MLLSICIYHRQTLYLSQTVLPSSAVWSSVFPQKFQNSAFVGVMWITCFLQTDVYAGAGTVYYVFV